MAGNASRRSLYGKMAGDTTLNALLAAPTVGQKSIFYQLAPDEAAYPYVLFSKQSSVPSYAFATRPALEAEVWLVKAVDRNTTGTADRVDAIAERLNTLLTDGTLSIAGSTQLYLRRMSDVDYSEVSEGQEYKHSGSLYQLIYE